MSLNDIDVQLGDLNDLGDDEFDNELDDEYGFDAHPPPGTEIGGEGVDVQTDYGSGSYADLTHYQGGRREVAEDLLMENGESQMGYGADINVPTNVPLPRVLPPGKQGEDWYQQANGDVLYKKFKASGDNKFYLWIPPTSPQRAKPKASFFEKLKSVFVGPTSTPTGTRPTVQPQPEPQPVFMPEPTPYMPPEVSPMVSSPLEDASDVMLKPPVLSSPDESAREARKAAAMAQLAKLKRAYVRAPATAGKEYRKMRETISAIGSAAMYGESEIGGAAEDGQSEVGGDDIQAPFESFMLDDVHMGSAAMYGPTEVGGGEVLNHMSGAAEMVAQAEIGSIGSGWAAKEGQSEIGAAVARVVEKARDNRRPAPPMKAVEPESPMEEDDWSLTDLFVGAAEAVGGANPFPLTSEFLLQAGGTVGPRFVVVTTEDGYKKFRTENSPELKDLNEKLEAHMSDPTAHAQDPFANELSDDIDDLVMLGEEVTEVEAQKRVDLWMPRHFDGKIEAWREGDHVYVSLAFENPKGEIRVATTYEPFQKCLAEICRHATESGVPAAAVTHVLPAMGCVLGAATAIKEVASAAPSLVANPKMEKEEAFVLRIEPKKSPNLVALAMLWRAAKKGNKQAAEEWKSLAAMSPPAVKQAMFEARELAKSV